MFLLIGIFITVDRFNRYQKVNIWLLKYKSYDQCSNLSLCSIFFLIPWYSLFTPSSNILAIFLNQYLNKTSWLSSLLTHFHTYYPDSKVHGANMGSTWVLSAPDGPYVGPMNLAIRVFILHVFLQYAHVWLKFCFYWNWARTYWRLCICFLQLTLIVIPKAFIQPFVYGN